MKKIRNQGLHIHPAGPLIPKDELDGICSIHQETRNENTILVGKPQYQKPFRSLK
jgi:hypothetical protein